MTETLLSLLSIILGIIGTLIFTKVYSKYSFGFKGNVLVGVFGSVFFIKIFNRLGLSPFEIVNENKIIVYLLILNLLISAIGGVFGILFLNKIKSYLNRNK